MTALRATRAVQDIQVKTDAKNGNNHMRSWGMKMVESNGDYRDETFLERLIGGPLYEGQNTIPRLPIPAIDATLQRLAPTVLPLARTVQEEIQFREACRKFPEQAQLLHERLTARRDGEFKNSSWIQLWWNQVRCRRCCCCRVRWNIF
jgi:hypothetical protein